MKAVIVNHIKDEFPLSWEEVPDPIIGEGKVLVNIHATAVNRADLLQREGNYPPPPGAPPYMGLEMAGTVAELGREAGEWKIGDRVCSLLSGGGYAEKVVIPHQLLIPVPEHWSFEKAAAVPETFYTAFVNLFLEANLEMEETVLIHGGASGVGTAAIQLAREAGCQVIVTAGHEKKIAHCLKLGAAFGVNYKEKDFEEAVLEACPNGVDVILDIGGSDYLASNLRLLKVGGRLVIIALLTGAQAQIDLSEVMRRRLRLIGSVLRSRSLEEKIEIARKFENRFWHLLLRGQIEPVIDAVLPIKKVEEAHWILKKNQNIGKVVLTIKPE